MRVPFRSHRLLATGAAVVLAASFLVAGGSPAGAVTYPPMTVSKTTAHSGADHGDSIDESGAGCTSTESSTSIVMYMATGVVADDQPINTDLTAFGYSVLPDAEGNWSGTYSVQGGGDLALPSGQYTLRTECDAGLPTLFIYAGVVITINGDQITTTTAPTTTADPGTTTTTVAGATTTTAAPATTAKPAAAVAAQATFTG